MLFRSAAGGLALRGSGRCGSGDSPRRCRRILRIGPFSLAWSLAATSAALAGTTGRAALAGELETAAKAKNDDGIAAARKSLGAGCQSCHTQHREKTETGFDIKY